MSNLTIPRPAQDTRSAALAGLLAPTGCVGRVTGTGCRCRPAIFGRVLDDMEGDRAGLRCCAGAAAADLAPALGRDARQVTVPGRTRRPQLALADHPGLITRDSANPDPFAQDEPAAWTLYHP